MGVIVFCSDYAKRIRTRGGGGVKSFFSIFSIYFFWCPSTQHNMFKINSLDCRQKTAALPDRRQETGMRLRDMEPACSAGLFCVLCAFAFHFIRLPPARNRLEARFP
jgi:hypothetical protein